MPRAHTRARDPKRGRTFGYAVFGLLVGALTAIFSTQILLQVFAPEGAERTGGCSQTIHRLSEALNRARQSAAGQSDEQAGITAFRGALLPEWSALPALERDCGTQTEYRTATEALVRLRYMEELNVRARAVELASARVRLERLLAALSGDDEDKSVPVGADLGPTP